MADHGHDITMTARLGLQNAKAILGIMVGDALDETGKNFLRLILGRVFHGRHIESPVSRNRISHRIVVECYSASWLALAMSRRLFLHAGQCRAALPEQ